jgi:microcystin-dependent protein
MEGTLGEVRMFAGNFAPRSWRFCDGSILSIAQNTAMFAIIGTTYGGDGQVTFGLPDFRGRLAVGSGNGSGLVNIQLGEAGGANSTPILLNNLPIHNHQAVGSITPRAYADVGNQESPENAFFGGSSTAPYNSVADVNMQPIAVNLPTSVVGGNSPMSVTQPYLGINYIICLEGIFPSRN